MRTFSRHPGRLRAIAACMAAVYLFASLGIMPTPAILAHWLGGALPVGASAERYPCDDHACGCVSASECWLHCCCHTPQQRLVWAVTHEVRPPDSVKFSEAQWLAATKAAQSANARDAGEYVTVAGDPPRQPVRGFSMSALACKGIQQILAMSVPPALPLRVGEMLTIPVVAPATKLLRDAAPASRSLEVPAPPPRHV